MRLSTLTYLITVFIALIFTTGCMNNPIDNPDTNPRPTQSDITPTPEVSIFDYPLAEVDFFVEVPGNTPDGDEIYLTLVDEVTGIALNPQIHQMEIRQTSEESTTNQYFLALPVIAGSTLKYRYARQSESILLPEHTSSGEPVRYRVIQVTNPMIVNDVVSRWTDTQFEGETGDLIGQVIDAENNFPLANVLVFAGGSQTLTAQDGFFTIQDLPPGLHNIVIYSKDGAYQIFQQGAVIEPDLPTMAPIELSPSEFVEVTFRVSLPEETPPLVPIRLAGNLEQLGNTFMTLSGGMSGDVEKMPVLQNDGDGSASITLGLPVGAAINYKYTMGDGFWNAEHTSTGEVRTRDFIVPDKNIEIFDKIENWDSDNSSRITFDVQVPDTTNPDDYVSIQFNPLFGWTEPIPMWSLGNNRWAYILLSPLNLPGNLTYRYCRNSECGTLDDFATPGIYGPGRPVSLDQLPVVLSDTVEAWTDQVSP